MPKNIKKGFYKVIEPFTAQCVGERQILWFAIDDVFEVLSKANFPMKFGVELFDVKGNYTIPPSKIIPLTMNEVDEYKKEREERIRLKKEKQIIKLKSVGTIQCDIIMETWYFPAFKGTFITLPDIGADVEFFVSTSEHLRSGYRQDEELWRSHDSEITFSMDEIICWKHATKKPVLVEKE